MTFTLTRHRSQENTSMAQHNVALKVSTELPVGSVDLELPVKRNGRRIGTFTVNAKGVSWNPATAKAASSVTWEDLPAALSGAQTSTALATAAPATKTSPRKAAPAKRPARKTAANQKSAPQRVEEPTSVAESDSVATVAPEFAAPEAEPASSTAAAETTTKANKSSAKKADAKPAAVDARAVRDWAASNGIQISPRGPIATRVLEQYRAATA